MTHMSEGERFASKAPPLNQAERDAINALFPAYIFRRSRTDEIWTTCCRKHMTVSSEDMMLVTPERNFPAVMWAPHQREQRNRWDDAPRPSVQCPLCGREVIVKELGRTGKQDNLSRYRRAVVLRWYRGALWARAYDCAKHYSRDRGYSLTDEPDCKLVGVYRFKPGLAEATTRCFWDYPFGPVVRQDGPLTKGRWNIHGPFYANAEYGAGYDVIGLDEIQKSPFRYCMAEEAEGRTDRFLQCTNRDIRIVELYKQLKERIPLTECAEWISNGVNVKETFRMAKKWGLPPEKLMRYLMGFVGCAQYGGMSSMGSALRCWEDYLTAAEAMGYQLHHENVLLPKNLGAAHDEATAQHRERLERERRIEQERQTAQRLADQRERDLLMADTYAERKVKLEENIALNWTVI